MNNNIRQLIICFLAVSGCNGCSHAMRLSVDPPQVKRQVITKVPLGTPMQVAEMKMQKLGFACEMGKEFSFQDQISTAGEYNRYLCMNYVVCYQERHRFFGFDRYWKVALLFDLDNRLTNVLVQVGQRTL